MGNIRSCCREKPPLEDAITAQTDWIFIDNVKKKLHDLTDQNDVESHDHQNTKSRVKNQSRFQKLESDSSENDVQSREMAELSVEGFSEHEHDEHCHQSTLESKAILNPRIRSSFSENDVRKSFYGSKRDGKYRSETQIQAAPSSESTAKQSGTRSRQSDTEDIASSNIPNEFKVFKQRILRHKASLRNDGDRSRSVKVMSVPTVSYRVRGRSRFYGNHSRDSSGRHSSPEGAFDVDFNNTSSLAHDEQIELSKSSYI